MTVIPPNDGQPLKIIGIRSIEPRIPNAYTVDVVFDLNRPATPFEAHAAQRIGEVPVVAGFDTISTTTTTGRLREFVLAITSEMDGINREAGNILNAREKALEEVRSALDGITFD